MKGKCERGKRVDEVIRDRQFGEFPEMPQQILVFLFYSIQLLRIASSRDSHFEGWYDSSKSPFASQTLQPPPSCESLSLFFCLLSH